MQISGNQRLRTLLGLALTTGLARAAEANPPEPTMDTPESDCVGNASGYNFPGTGLRPASPADAVFMVRRNHPHPSQVGGIRGADFAPPIPPAPAHLTVSGELCATASDAVACRSATVSPPELALQTHCSSGMVNQPSCTSWTLGYTRGDEVGWVGAEQLGAFLGTIDTEAEARLLVWAESYTPVCDTTKKGTTWVVNASRQLSQCPITHAKFVLSVSEAGELAVLSEEVHTSPGCVGRLPEGLQPLPAPARELAAWLAHTAHLEAAAVVAFDTLRAELEDHGAPASLLDALAEAREDEVRHATDVGALARALGGEIPAPKVDTAPPRSLEAIALENAREGLVRETWGALVGLWQASQAAHPEVRSLMATVAPDEVRHAELSQTLHRWLLTRLDSDAQARVEAERTRAWEAMAAQISEPDALTRALGLPSGDVARAMVAVLAHPPAV